MNTFKVFLTVATLLSSSMTRAMEEGAPLLIETTEIAPINPETYGLEQGGGSPISPDIWQGLTHAQVMALLEKLPLHQTNSILKRLQKCLLVTSTHMPTKGEADQGNLLAQRINHLEKSGDIKSAYLLAKGYPKVLEKDHWQWLQFAHALTEDRLLDAWTAAREALADNPDEIRWSKAMIALQLLKEEKEAALLSLSLLEEKKSPELQAFLTLAHHKMDGKVLPSDFIPQDLVEEKLLGRKGSSPKEKLLDAEAAYGTGDMSQEVLEALYQEHGDVPPQPAVLEGSMNDDLIALPEVPLDWRLDDPFMRAKIYGLLQVENEPTKKAKLLHQGIQHMRLHQREFLRPLFLEHLKALPVDASFKEYGKDFAELLLEQGEQSLAVQWLAHVSLDDKVHLAPWIIFGVDDISLSAKQNLFSRWYDVQEDSLKTSQTLGFFEALVPGVTENRMILCSAPQKGEDVSMDMILPLHFASSAGAKLVYALVLGGASTSSASMPLVVEGLLASKHPKMARLLALSYFKKP